PGGLHRMRSERICFWLLSLLCLAGCREDILHGLEEREANRVKLALAEAGIDAEKAPDGSSWSIAVDRRSAEAALAVLEHRRVLPEEAKAKPPEPSGLLQSKEERRHYLERRTAEALEETLERLPGVI